MRFLLDEGLPYRLATFLRQEGHDVTTVGVDYPHALPDEDVLVIARGEGRTIITNDKDFGELAFRRHLPHAGIILFRVGYLPITTRLTLLERVLRDHSHELDQFIVITAQSIRVRRAASG